MELNEKRNDPRGPHNIVGLFWNNARDKENKKRRAHSFATSGQYFAINSDRVCTPVCW